MDALFATSDSTSQHDDFQSSSTYSALTSWTTALQYALLQAGSYFTEPACKLREHLYLPKITNETDQISIHYSKLAVVACAILAPFTAPMGALCRRVANLFGSTIHLQYSGRGKTFDLANPAESLKVLSYNVCYMPGGYAITDGGVTPPSYKNRERIDKNNQLINALNADIVCLQEIPDIQDAAHVTSGLKNDYSDFIEVPGIKAMGPSSMMYVASKYKIDPQSVEFTPFVKENIERTVSIWFQCVGSHLINHLGSFLQNPIAAWREIQTAVQKSLPRIELTGRAASSEKGFLSFTLTNSNVTVICSHLQHSETPAVPTGDDKLSRRFQMLKIAEKIKIEREKGRIVIFTGDLNQEESELNVTIKTSKFQDLQLQRDLNVQGEHTWGGDGWCAPLRDEPASGPLVLDYTFVSGAKSITTKIHDVGFKGDEFRFDGLSDHKPLLSTILL